jgi:mono/diheme cytochrome c family protein
MKSVGMGLCVLALLLLGIAWSNEASAKTASSKWKAADAGARSVERGRYLVKVAGCNDCHTPGYLLSSGNTPEERWLTGDTFGWRGPWGTTYGSNLRIFVGGMSEPAWVAAAKTLRRRPTMPWFNLNAMRGEDLKAIYRFIKSLGPVGEPAPAYVPPDQEPKTPYALFPSAAK